MSEGIVVNLKKLSTEQLNQAFLDSGMGEMKFAESKYKDCKLIEGHVGRVANMQYYYTGLWFDEEEQQQAISDLCIWFDFETGAIVADCEALPKYIGDFL